MNSLSFLSKQFDVVASTSVPRTPASTPTDERFPQPGESGVHDMSHARLRRSRTWSARSFFIPTPAQSPNYNQRRPPPPPTRSRKRSGSTPISARYPVGSSSVPFPSSSSTSASGASDDPSEVRDMGVSSSQPSPLAQPTPPTIQPKLTPTELSCFQRIYFMRLLYLLINWLWTGFSTAVSRATLRHGLSTTVQNGKQKAEIEDDTTGDEKDSDDDLIMARSPSSLSKRPTTIRSRTSSIASIVLPPTTKPPTPSPLSKSYTPPPPTVTITPEATELREPPHPSLSTSVTDGNLLHPSQHGIRASATAPSLSSSNTTPDSSSSSSPKSHKVTPLHQRKTLVLDLDETLIHSTTRPYNPSATGGSGILDFGSLIGFGGKTKKAGHMVEVYMGGRSTLYHVYKRPFVDYFLRKVSTWYTLVIFTASMKEYADPVIDWLDAGRGILGLRFFREHCTQLENGAYAKDLSILNVDLSRVCLVDNSPVSYIINPANGIPIEGWTQDPSDEALLDLLPVLDSLRFTSDVRHVLGLRGF